MNPRIEKLKAERDRLHEKDMAYQERIKQLDEQIVGIVRENGLTIDELAELLVLLDKQPNAPLPDKFMNMEEDDEER